MKRFIEGEDRSQGTLFPEHLDDYIAADDPVRVIDVFVEGLDLNELGFEDMQPEATGRPAYHPASLLKNLHLRLSKPHSVQPAPGARDPTQHRTDLAYGPPDAGLQDDRGLSQG
jgi:hypothetical protein